MSKRPSDTIEQVQHKVDTSLPGSGSYFHTDIKVLLDYIDQLEKRCQKYSDQLIDAENRLKDSL